VKSAELESFAPRNLLNLKRNARRRLTKDSRGAAAPRESSCPDRSKTPKYILPLGKRATLASPHTIAPARPMCDSRMDLRYIRDSELRDQSGSKVPMNILSMIGGFDVACDS
jgi:hypothetical protein